MTPITFDEAVDAVEAFEAFPYFHKQVGGSARALIARELMRLANHDIELIVNHACRRAGATRELILEPPANGPLTDLQRAARDAKSELFDVFCRFGYSLAEARTYIHITDRFARANYIPRLPHEPKQRLDVFLPWFVSTNPNGFPGLSELTILWGNQFCCADGSSETRESAVEGHTFRDHENGAIVPMIALQPEPELLLLEEEKLTPAERKEMAAGFTLALARVAR